jgi:PhnB protein
MTKNPPEGYQRVVPQLGYADAPAAIDFLCRAFGFSERFRMPMPDGTIGHAELACGDNVIMLASLWREAGHASPRELGGVHGQLMVYVDDVDAHYARARDAGATIIAEPEDQFYGARTYRAVDPEGHRWIFATQVRDVPLENLT